MRRPSLHLTDLNSPRELARRRDGEVSCLQLTQELHQMVEQRSSRRENDLLVNQRSIEITSDPGTLPFGKLFVGLEMNDVAVERREAIDVGKLNV